MITRAAPGRGHISLVSDGSPKEVSFENPAVHHIRLLWMVSPKEVSFGIPAVHHIRLLWMVSPKEVSFGIPAVHHIHLLLDGFVVDGFEQPDDEFAVKAKPYTVFEAVADDLVPAFQL